MSDESAERERDRTGGHESGARNEPAGRAPGRASHGRLEGRLVALGITGSIAAYKTPELVRLLQGEGADVQTLLTSSATRFVAPLALEALTRHAAETDVLALMPDGRIGHIVVADSADAVVVAPATAHWLASMASGLAGDVVTATCLATSAPVVVAPAMDGEMYAHAATRANVTRLRDDFGYLIVEPESGPLASGQVGVGRLAELASIVDAAVAAVGDRPIRAPSAELRPPFVSRPREADLAGRRLVVTAGGTAEPIDPVRFIGNRSTGKMGAAIAAAALDRGAQVTIVAGHVTTQLPDGATIVPAATAGEMREALLEVLVDEGGQAGFDALLMAAAVSDFRPARTAGIKLERGQSMTLELEPTPDILAEVSRTAQGIDSAGSPTRRPLSPRPILVGFAAETGSLQRAPDKLIRKGVDLLVGNDVAQAGSGFGTDTNRITLYAPGEKPEAWPLLSKREVADRLLDHVARLLDERDRAEQNVTMAAIRARSPQETRA